MLGAKAMPGEQREPRTRRASATARKDETRATGERGRGAKVSPPLAAGQNAGGVGESRRTLGRDRRRSTAVCTLHRLLDRRRDASSATPGSGRAPGCLRRWDRPRALNSRRCLCSRGPRWRLLPHRVPPRAPARPASLLRARLGFLAPLRPRSRPGDVRPPPAAGDPRRLTCDQLESRPHSRVHPPPPPPSQIAPRPPDRASTVRRLGFVLGGGGRGSTTS